VNAYYARDSTKRKFTFFVLKAMRERVLCMIRTKRKKARENHEFECATRMAHKKRDYKSNIRHYIHEILGCDKWM